ncbi:DUF177 domain-containing protein [Rhodobacteraceae bacterium RKSG542]|uniref:YceD family protein n=1 Tax=Pseudovibrio flavus TaxID=2529854 RepID=UPI0012BC7740|nr:DUF177 domain-containing protein [Pseudovibrio flavus]MTI17369.1 DUF177 domain-containing protein [Pseudovibrio flavus]
MSNSDYPYVHMMDVSRLANSARTVTLDLNEADRAAIAKAYGLIAVETLKADLVVRPWRKTGVAVEGSFSGKVIQRCVVTLEPIEVSVEDDIDRKFIAEDTSKRRKNRDDGLEVDIDFDAIDPPEHFDGKAIDLGSVLCEQLALVLDPYPRAEGVEIDASFAPTEDEDEDEEEQRPNPFAALAALKKDKNS